MKFKIEPTFETYSGVYQQYQSLLEAYNNKKTIYKLSVLENVGGKSEFWKHIGIFSTEYEAKNYAKQYKDVSEGFTIFEL